MRIAFYRGSAITDKIILFVCRGGYSHVATVFNDGSIIEAYPFNGVRARKSITDGMKGYTIDVYEVATTPEQDVAIRAFLESQLGKDYDWWAIFGFVLHTTEQARRKYGKWICSELVFTAFQKAAVSLLLRVDAWKVSPTILSYNTMMTYIETIKT